MNKINEVITYSGAIQAMCEGLKMEASLKNLDAPGEEGVCFRRAATNIIMQLPGMQPKPSSKNVIKGTDSKIIPDNLRTAEGRAEALGFDYEDLACFEHPLNFYRLGEGTTLFYYFNPGDFPNELLLPLAEVERYPLNDESWKENLKHHEKFASIAKKLGY